MVSALTIQDIFDWNRNYKNYKTAFRNYYTPSEESRMFGAFHYLLEYYFVKDNCINALQKLMLLSADDNFFSTGAVKEWTSAHEWLGTKKLIMFLVDNEVYEEEQI